MRLTEKKDSGRWCLRDVPWDDLKPGVVISKKTWEKLYGALWKLKDYEDSGKNPDNVVPIPAVRMVEYEGDWVPKECCSFTNPITSGGKSYVDDVDMPCVNCQGICAACVVQMLMNDYARVTNQTENLEKRTLTKSELIEMAGKPVYCSNIEAYGIVKYETKGRWAGIPFLVGTWHENGLAVNFEYNISERGLKCYKIDAE